MKEELDLLGINSKSLPELVSKFSSINSEMRKEQNIENVDDDGYNPRISGKTMNILSGELFCFLLFILFILFILYFLYIADLWNLI